MVGQRFLVPFIEVRVLVGQQSSTKYRMTEVGHIDIDTKNVMKELILFFERIENKLHTVTTLFLGNCNINDWFCFFS